MAEESAYISKAASAAMKRGGEVPAQAVDGDPMRKADSGPMDNPFDAARTEPATAAGENQGRIVVDPAGKIGLEGQPGAGVEVYGAIAVGFGSVDSDAAIRGNSIPVECGQLRDAKAGAGQQIHDSTIASRRAAGTQLFYLIVSKQMLLLGVLTDAFYLCCRIFGNVVFVGQPGIKGREVSKLVVYSGGGYAGGSVQGEVIPQI